MEIPNQDKIWMFGENEIYKYLGILEVDTIKQEEKNGKILKESCRRNSKLLEKKSLAETLSPLYALV